MIVTVVKASVYAGPGFVSLPFAEEGATIDIQDGWYAQSMIEGGYVALPVEPVPVVVETEPKQPVEPVVEVEPPPMPVEEPTKKKGK